MLQPISGQPVMFAIFSSRVLEQPVQQASAKTTATKKEEKKINSNSTKHYGKNENNRNSNIQPHAHSSLSGNIFDTSYHILMFCSISSFLDWELRHERNLWFCMVWRLELTCVFCRRLPGSSRQGRYKRRLSPGVSSFRRLEQSPEKKKVARTQELHTFGYFFSHINQFLFTLKCILFFLLLGWGIDFVRVC